MKAEPFLGIEIYVVHLSHFLLFSGALAILALNVPLWPCSLLPRLWAWASSGAL